MRTTMVTLGLLASSCFEVDKVDIALGDDVIGAGVDTDLPEEPPAAPDEEEESSAPPQDTAPPPLPVDTGTGTLIPEAFSFTALFAYDPATDQAVPWVWSGTVLGPLFDFQVGTEDFFLGNADTEGCTMELQATGPVPRPPWATEVLFGLSADTTLPFLTNCAGVLRPASIRAVQDFFRTAFGWGVGVQPLPFSPNVATIATNAGLDGISLPGGMILGVPPLTAAMYDREAGITLGFQLDEAFQVQMDPAGNWLPMTDSEMVVDGRLVRGLYSVTVLYMFTLN